jgi:hypothetical protein
MTPQKRKGRLMVLLKSLILGITCLSFLGLLSCDNTGTVSTTSASGGSGTGTGWRIDIQVGTNPIQPGQTTTVMAIVRDSSGAPAPSGTYGCMTAVKNCFIQGDQCYATLCNTTTNNLGQFIQTYAGGIRNDKGDIIGGTGDDRIEVSSQGVIAAKIITVNN